MKSMTTITIQAKKPSKKLIATLEYIAHNPEVADEVENYIIQKKLGNDTIVHTFTSFGDLKDYIIKR